MTGFVLSLTCCLSLVGAIFGLVGLSRTKRPDGHRGRWAAVTAIAVGFSLTALSAGFITLAVLTDEPIDDLQVGECFDANGLQGDYDENGADVSDLEETSCNGRHDAEVLAVDELTADQADDFEFDSVDICEELIVDHGHDLDAVQDAGLIVPILDSIQPDAGDLLVCALTSDDGSGLTAPYEGE